MNCHLEGQIKQHEAKRNARLNEVFVKCPLFDRHICLSCCLHIEALAAPMSRATAQDNDTQGYTDITSILDRSLDDIWQTCSRCTVKSF